MPSLTLSSRTAIDDSSIHMSASRQAEELTYVRACNGEIDVNNGLMMVMVEGWVVMMSLIPPTWGICFANQV